MPSICGLDPAAWQETCDHGAVVFLAMGVGPEQRALHHAALGQAARTPSSAAPAGCGVPGTVLSAPHPHPKGSQRGQPLRGASLGPEKGRGATGQEATVPWSQGTSIAGLVWPVASHALGPAVPDQGPKGSPSSEAERLGAPNQKGCLGSVRRREEGFDSWAGLGQGHRL